MSELKIITNQNWRQFTYRSDVPDSIFKDQFSHLSNDDIDGFFKYRNYWYHLSDFIVTTIKGWDGVVSDSFFSGVLIKISNDGERYKVGTYFS